MFFFGFDGLELLSIYRKPQRTRITIVFVLFSTLMLLNISMRTDTQVDAAEIYTGQKKLISAGEPINKANICRDVDQRGDVILMQLDDEDNEVAIMCNTRNPSCRQGIMMCTKGRFQCVCRA